MSIFSKIKNRKEQKATTKPVEEKQVEEKKPVKKVAKESKSEAKVSDHKQVKSEYGHRILIKPLITEKSAFLHEKNQYLFEVAGTANKVEVKKAVKEVFGVDASKVRIINQAGKRVNFGRRKGKRNDVKKAIVTLPKGQSIKIYEGV